MRIKKIMTGSAAALALAGILSSTMVFAASHSTPESAAAKARQSQMQLYAHNLGVLGGMAKGATAYDADTAQAAADNLAALVALKQIGYWLPNSSTDDMEGTAALPAIWQAGSDVGAKGKAMADAVMAMQAAAGSLEGVQASIGALGGACGACHKAYRKPSN